MHTANFRESQLFLGDDTSQMSDVMGTIHQRSVSLNEPIFTCNQQAETGAKYLHLCVGHFAWSVSIAVKPGIQYIDAQN
jgi:hypothetical protein